MIPEDEEEEEEFLESLPTDMMDEDDLEQIKAMAHKASFLTRDISSRSLKHALLSSFFIDYGHSVQLIPSSLLLFFLHFSFVKTCSAPVHAKKRKSEQSVEKYEKMPRKMQMQKEKELIHLLPIKDKSGLIPQSMEKPGACRLVTPHSSGNAGVLERMLSAELCCLIVSSSCA